MYEIRQKKAKVNKVVMYYHLYIYLKSSSLFCLTRTLLLLKRQEQ